jgi:citrate lyase subunit gamma (acyl carrier protein)
MKVVKSAIAGTLESSDIQITITANEKNENQIILESPVKHLFEAEINKVINETLDSHQLKGVLIKAIDKGALNCTIAARVQTAIYRATGKDIQWEVL